MSAPAPAASFEEHFAREMLASERVRVGILIWVLVALIAIFPALYFAYRGVFLQFFSRPAVLAHFGLILGALLLYELAIRRVMGRWLREGASLPQTLRYLNAFVETSVPTLLMLTAARGTDPAHVLQSPAVLLYGVFIVLSTLRLDYRLPAFTGLVAATEYVALVLYFGERGTIDGTPFAAPPFYLGKAVMLLLCGLAAGFVAHQLKRRIGNAWRSQQERQRLLNAFGQQVSPSIVDELMRQGGEIASRRAVVCILFMDIRNFTPMTERMTPEEIVALQNSVFSVAIDIVNRHGGVINQFLGDGFMATFGAPVSGGADCRSALAVARELVARLPVRIGVGLHAGEAVTGNVGSAERKQYSITGAVVILAARIEQLNKEFGSQILASREVLAAAGEDPAGASSLGPVGVKGREQPIELFRLA
ncbi:MAG: adenylate/guanylate cyclase domain-containing protein [Betaproteobacteria bacterium]